MCVHDSSVCVRVNSSVSVRLVWRRGLDCILFSILAVLALVVCSSLVKAGVFEE